MGEIKRDILQQSDNMIRHYERFSYEEIADIYNARTDYETYSTIKIKKRDGNGDYVEIPLINADSYQKLGSEHNWDKYMVLVQLAGSGKDFHATGQIVRRDINRKGKAKSAMLPKIKTAKDNNFGVL